MLGPRGDTISTTSSVTDAAELAWGPALTPYLAVDDARRALEWYAEVFDAERRGEPYVMPDGRIGYAELGIGEAVLMLADEYPEEGLRGPKARGGPSMSIHAQAPDVDAIVQRAVVSGAELTRPVADQPYGRTACSWTRSGTAGWS